MAKKMKSSGDGNYPTTRQTRFGQPDSDLGSTTALPRSKEFDLQCGERVKVDSDEFNMTNHCQSYRPNEQTFTAPRRGNKVMDGGNF